MTQHTFFGQFSTEFEAWATHEHDQRLLESLRKRVTPDGVVLDAGCGDGTLSVGLAPHVRRVVGVDLESGMLALASRKAVAAGVDNTSFVVGDLSRLPVADRGFDLAVCSFALHHTEVDDALPRLAAKLKPGGWLFMQEPTCPVRGVWRPLWYRWQGLRAAGSALQDSGLSAAWETGRFHQSQAWMTHQLEDNHWEVDRWRRTVDRHLPNAAFQRTQDKVAVIVLWQRPSDGAEVEAQEDAAMSEAPAADPTRVARHYPMPAPEDFVPFPGSALEGSVVARFEDQAARHAERIALCTGTLRLSYAELNAQANRAAHRLLGESGTIGDRVAVLMDQDEPVVPAILGVLKAGRAYVILDPADSPERHGRVQALAEAGTLITTAARAAAIDGIPGAPKRRIIWEELVGDSDANPGLSLGPNALAAVFFTSGSTGEPKGVARDHRQLLHSTWVNTNGYFVSPSDRQSMLHFPGFTASVPNLYDTLLNGAALHTLNPRRVSISALLAWLREARITHFNPPIGLWRQMAPVLPRDAEWSDLRLVTLGGEAIYSKDLKQFKAIFGRGTTLLYGLSMTEAGAVTHGYIDHTAEIGDGPVLAGYPLPDKEVKILDEHGEPVATGRTGRVAITSAYLSLGYWRDEAHTDAAFRPATDGSDRRTFLTADRGRLEPDGCLEYFGRQDSIIKVRGYRVDTTAVEAALNTHPDVTQAAVVVCRRGDGNVSLVAYLTGRGGAYTTAGSLREYLSERVSHFMIPERFTWLDTMPLTSTNKINRLALSELTATRPNLDEPYVAPRTPLEERISAIWAEMLELDRVGVNDDFFVLGGDSLLAMAMVQRVEERLGITTPPDILGAATVAEFTGMISGVPDSADAGVSPKPPARWKRRGSAPYTPKTVLRHWFHKGPVVGGRALPYGLGIRLHRVFAAQLWLHRRLYRRQLHMLAHWQEEMGGARNRTIIITNIIANTWKVWRREALMPHRGLDRWVTFSGDGKNLLMESERPRGMVLVFSHAVSLATVLQGIVEARGRESALVVNDHAVEKGTAKNASREVQARAAQLAEAHRVLQCRGVAVIAGDGLQGKQTVPVPFHGRLRPFQIGAAWLAVQNDADFVPVFTTIDATGRVNIEIVDPLITSAKDESEKITELTRRYGELYARRWPSLYPSTGWGHLRYNARLPET